MKAGYSGTFVISWTQTEIDGAAVPDASALAVGAVWRWSGPAVRIDGPQNVLVLGAPEGMAELRRRAARNVRRLVGEALLDRPARVEDTVEVLGAPEDPLLDQGFAVTDGRRRYTVTLIAVADARPLLMFMGDCPPENTDLWITHVLSCGSRLNRIDDAPKSVICFTPDTRLDTPEGPRPVADLAEGDLVLTKDNGAQPIRWRGQRRLSGARLRAMPDLRPVRIRAGAAGLDVPDGDLLVSPDHRMLVKGAMAVRLFNTDEVLVRARDLLNDRTVVVDHRLCEVTYVHLMFDRHQVIWANGLECESFHPVSMALDAIDPMDRAALAERMPDVARDAALYGAYARRALSRAEAAIFLHEAAGRH